MSTVHNQMTNLANEVRILSSTENLLSITTMTQNINKVNVEISEQADLIAQINTTLDNLGSENGTTPPDICTVGILFTGQPDIGQPDIVVNASVTCYENGAFIRKKNAFDYNWGNENVVVGSVVTISSPGYVNFDCNGAEKIAELENGTVHLFRITVGAGEIAMIFFEREDA